MSALNTRTFPKPFSIKTIPSLNDMGDNAPINLLTIIVPAQTAYQFAGQNSLRFFSPSASGITSVNIDTWLTVEGTIIPPTSSLAWGTGSEVDTPLDDQNYITIGGFIYNSGSEDVSITFKSITNTGGGPSSLNGQTAVYFWEVPVAGFKAN